MANRIVEFFGYAPKDESDEASEARRHERCPFMGNKCTKEIGSVETRIRSGVCTIGDGDGSPVVICPIRLYADEYKLLRRVAEIAFKTNAVQLVSGKEASLANRRSNTTLVAVFGKGWGGELRVPGRASQQGRKTTHFFVDWILAKLDSSNSLVEFAALEVQTMDTIGSYREERQAILRRAEFSGKSAGPNWENVNKRILPQLIYKGHLLEREPLCQSGLFFACPEAVHNKILDRLGAPLQPYPIKNNSLTFLPVRLEPNGGSSPVRELTFLEPQTTTVQQVQIAFSSPTNLPDAGAYEQAIRKALA